MSEGPAENIPLNENLTKVYLELYPDQFEPPLPHWADKRLNGEYERYAQLSTKDGRKLGNAIITNVLTEDVLPSWMKDMAPMFDILTDFGHTLRLTQRELEEAYHPPELRMKANRVKFRSTYMGGYLTCDRLVRE